VAQTHHLKIRSPLMLEQQVPTVLVVVATQA
jgi:hypothetical protein